MLPAPNRKQAPSTASTSAPDLLAGASAATRDGSGWDCGRGCTPPQLRGGPGAQPHTLPEEQPAPQTGRLHGAGCGTGRGRQRFRGGRGWRVAACPAPRLPARKALGLGPVQAAREPKPREVLPAEAPAGRSRTGQPRLQPGRDMGLATRRHRRAAWGQGPLSISLPWHLGGSGPTARLQLPSRRGRGCPRVLGAPESSPAAGWAASRAGTPVIPAPTWSVLGARGRGW